MAIQLPSLHENRARKQLKILILVIGMLALVELFNDSHTMLHSVIHHLSSKPLSVQPSKHQNESLLGHSLILSNTNQNSSTPLQTNRTTDVATSAPPPSQEPKPLKCKIRQDTSRNATKKSSPFPIFPHMILVGAQKAGTSALNEALKFVPEFMEARRNEPHYWDFQALPKLKRGNLTRHALCNLANDYASYWPSLMTNVTPSTVVYEKTPSLLAIPDVAWAIRTFLDTIRPNHPIKILALLRDPVQRFYSHYKMDFQHGDTTLRVEEIIEREATDLVRRGLLKAPMYNQNISMEDMDHEMWNISNFGIGNTVPPHYKTFVARGFYSRQLLWYMKYFTLGESLLVVRYEDFQQKPVETLERIMKFVTGKDMAVSETVRLALDTDLGPAYAHRQEHYYPMSNHSEQYLRLLYKPFNDELADLLGESWRNVWD